jgi:predicted amidophosphoribosyltransferase
VDRPLDQEIKETAQHLEQLKKKDPSSVFHCPVCGKDFARMSNYNELKMCFACFKKTKTEEMKKHVECLLGGTIEDIEVEPVDPLRSLGGEKPVITQVVVKTKDGKIVKLNKEEQVAYIL